MTQYHLIGTITETGDLQITLPDGIPVGRVRVVITPEAETETPRPMTGAELVAMMEATNGYWRDTPVEDSVQFVDDLRRTRS